MRFGVPGRERIAEGVRGAAAEAGEGIGVDSPGHLAARVEFEQARVARALPEQRVHRQKRVLAAAGKKQIVVRHQQTAGGAVGNPIGEAIEIAHLAGLVGERLGVVQDVHLGQVAIGHAVAVHARLAEGAEHQVEDAVAAVGVAPEKEQGALTVDEAGRPPDLELHAVRGAPAGDAHENAALADFALEHALDGHQIVGHRPVELRRRDRSDDPRDDDDPRLVDQPEVVDQLDAWWRPPPKTFPARGPGPELRSGCNARERAYE